MTGTSIIGPPGEREDAAVPPGPTAPPEVVPDLGGAPLRAAVLARWVFAAASLLAALVGSLELRSVGLILTAALVAGNLVVLRGVRGSASERMLRRVALASLGLDLLVALTWVALDTARPEGGQMYLSLGLVGIEAAALFGRTVTLVALVAIMAILGGAEVVGYSLYGRPQQLPVALLRVCLLWAIVLLGRALVGGFATRGGYVASIGVQGTATTELKETAFQEVLDGAPSAIIAADDGGHVVMVNAAAQRIFGHNRREMLGMAAGKLVPGIYDDLPHGSGPRYLTREITTAGQDKAWEGTRRDGSSFPAEVTYSTLQIGQRVLVAASVRDITDRVKAEQERDAYKTQLEESQRLESLGRLAGGIAHDFNNMLNVILNYTDFVEEATDSDPAIKADLGEIRAAGKRAARLTQQLLRLAGREALRPEPINLAEEVRGMEGRLRSMLGPGINLRVDIPEGLSQVVADPTMINEVLGILVDNSAHAMPAGGEILVEAVHAVVTPEVTALQPDLAAGASVVLRVADNGEGMDEETRSRALEPFFSTRVSLGGGLGLPTAYGLVRQSGGAMLIDSTPGAGTTVEVYLPVADLAALRAAAGGTHDEPRRGRQAAARELDMVLLLDHDEAIRTRTADVLIRNNFQVVEARDGAEALRLAVEEQARIKLVMLDRVMGSMLDSGLPEMLKSLLPDARVILMSSFSRAMLSSQGLDDPSLPFMDKDCTEQQLLEKVGEVVYGMTPRLASGRGAP